MMSLLPSSLANAAIGDQIEFAVSQIITSAGT
jgi:hypothetical protein